MVSCTHSCTHHVLYAALHVQTQYKYGVPAKAGDPQLILGAVFPAAKANDYYDYQIVDAGGETVELTAGEYCIQASGS